MRTQMKYFFDNKDAHKVNNYMRSIGMQFYEDTHYEDDYVNQIFRSRIGHLLYENKINDYDTDGDEMDHRQFFDFISAYWSSLKPKEISDILNTVFEVDIF
jgi:hypothetical protein